MLDLIQAQIDALEAARAMRRLFIWCEARDPDTGDPAPAGFWDDVGTVEHNGRVYYGSGGLITVGNLSAVSNLSIPALTVTLSGLSPEVAALVRGSTVGQAPISVSVGIFDPDTRDLIGSLKQRFVGFVDEIEITTPAAGDESIVVLTCESTSRALTIQRTDTRSEASQQQRDPSDHFYSYTGLQRTKPVYFGQSAR